MKSQEIVVRGLDSIKTPLIQLLEEVDKRGDVAVEVVAVQCSSAQKATLGSDRKGGQ